MLSNNLKKNNTNNKKIKYIIIGIVAVIIIILFFLIYWFVIRDSNGNGSMGLDLKNVEENGGSAPFINENGEEIIQGQPIITTSTIEDWDPESENTEEEKSLKDNEDQDNDYLTNGAEEYLGTDPYKKDTDSDGLSDYTEAVLFLTDPLLSDSDQDGYDDYSEIFNGFDPNGDGKLSESMKNTRDSFLLEDIDNDGFMDYKQTLIPVEQGIQSLDNSAEPLENE